MCSFTLIAIFLVSIKFEILDYHSDEDPQTDESDWLESVRAGAVSVSSTMSEFRERLQRQLGISAEVGQNSCVIF